MKRPIEKEYEVKDLRLCAAAMDEDDNLYLRDVLMWAADKIEDQADAMDHWQEWRERNLIATDER